MSEIRIASHGFIRKDNKILLGIRNKPSSYFHGKYFTIGGGVEAGETLENCFKREAMEEANISIKNVQFSHVREFVHTGVHQLVFIHIAEYDGGNVCGDDDCVDPKFFALDEIKDLIRTDQIGSTVVENLKLARLCCV